MVEGVCYKCKMTIVRSEKRTYDAWGLLSNGNIVCGGATNSDDCPYEDTSINHSGYRWHAPGLTGLELLSLLSEVW